MVYSSIGNDEITLLARSFGRSLSRLNFNSNYFWLKINEFTGGSGEPYPFALRSKPEVAACVRIYSLIACDDGNRQAMTSRKIYRLIIPHNRITHTHTEAYRSRAHKHSGLPMLLLLLEMDTQRCSRFSSSSLQCIRINILVG